MRVCESTVDTDRPIAFIKNINAAPRCGLIVGKDNSFAHKYNYSIF